MYHVVCATTNPAKIQAIHQAFDDIYGEDAAILNPSPSIAVCLNSHSETMKRELAHDAES